MIVIITRITTKTMIIIMMTIMMITIITMTLTIRGLGLLWPGSLCLALLVVPFLAWVLSLSLSLSLSLLHS